MKSLSIATEFRFADTPRSNGIVDRLANCLSMFAAHAETNAHPVLLELGKRVQRNRKFETPSLGVLSRFEGHRVCSVPLLSIFGPLQALLGDNHDTCMLTVTTRYHCQVTAE